MSAARVSLTAAAFGLCLCVAAAAPGRQFQEAISKSTEVLTDVLLKSSESTAGDRFNQVTAPFASSVILALAAEGAEAETKNQLVAALGGELPDKDTYKEVLTSIKGYSLGGAGTQNRVVLKNFLYVYKNYSVLDSFAELARDYYLTDVRTVARPSLEVTRAALGRSIDDGSDTAEDSASANNDGFDEHAMLIFNGFSLELNWPTSTWHKTSVSWNGNVHRAFGAAGNFAIGQVPSVDSTAFVLPYKNTDYALLVVMPKNKDSSLDGVLSKISEIGIDGLTKTMTMRPAFVTMPCFQNTNITYIKTLLQKRTQVQSLFTKSADLPKLSSDKLFLDDVVQQAGIRVCVEGTSANSLSSSAFTSQRVIKESVVADRPFAYALYNVINNVVLVAGKLEQPEWDETDEDFDSDVETIKI